MPPAPPSAPRPARWRRARGSACSRTPTATRSACAGSKACVRAARGGGAAGRTVALRIGQHVPPLVAALADVRRYRSEVEQPLQLGVLVRVGGVDVDVQPRLARRRVGRRREDQGRCRTAEARGRPDLDRAVVLPPEDDVVEDGGPEGGQRLGVAAVDDELAEPAGHGRTLGGHLPAANLGPCASFVSLPLRACPSAFSTATARSPRSRATPSARSPSPAPGSPRPTCGCCRRSCRARWSASARTTPRTSPR